MDIICVTDMRQSVDDFYNRIEQIALAKPSLIILREKHLSEKKFKEVCLKCKEIVPIDMLSANTFIDVAKNNGIRNIHLSFKDFIKKESKLNYFQKVGVSIHSKDEAVIAEEKGADYLIAGHIFDTDCKKGVEARGVEFLKKICDAVNMPVYAIGGISLEKVKEIERTGAYGVCVMSGLMKAYDPYLEVISYLGK